jgi:Tol biopolymer transport system component
VPKRSSLASDETLSSERSEYRQVKTRWGFISAASCVLLVLAGPAQAAFPGNNGKIVVSAHDGNDYELFEAFPGMVNITDTNDDPLHENGAQWNHTGDLIATSCNSTGQPDVCTYDQDGVFVERLTDLSDLGAYNPAWNKTGSMIAYHGYDGNDTEIFKVGTSGSDTPIPITSSDNVPDLGPEWSPNGRWITFERQTPAGEYLFRMRPDGTSIERISKRDTQGVGWSPDSKLLVIDRTVPRGNGDTQYEIFTMKPNGDDATRVTFTKRKDEIMPEWSPDGKWLVFIQNSGSIVKMRLSDGKRTSVSHDPANFGQPTWQPVLPP